MPADAVANEVANAVTNAVANGVANAVAPQMLVMNRAPARLVETVIAVAVVCGCGHNCGWWQNRQTDNWDRETKQTKRYQCYLPIATTNIILNTIRIRDNQPAHSD